jgi:hypothetical protein
MLILCVDSPTQGGGYECFFKDGFGCASHLNQRSLKKAGWSSHVDGPD